MKVEVLIAEPGEGACTGDRNARCAGERAHRLPALFEVRARGEGGPGGKHHGHQAAQDHEKKSPHLFLLLILGGLVRSEEHTSELQSHLNLVCRLLLAKQNLVARSAPAAS